MSPLIWQPTSVTAQHAPGIIPRKVGAPNVLSTAAAADILVGPQQLSLVHDVFRSCLQWMVVAHYKPTSLPESFALPSLAVEELICRSDYHYYIWEHIRRRMRNVGFDPPQAGGPHQYPGDVSMWDIKGLLTKTYFEEWKMNRKHKGDFEVFGWRDLVKFLESELRTLLDKTPVELDKIRVETAKFFELLDACVENTRGNDPYCW